jgi:O-acetylhomoserine (thiol)-lyase
VLDIPRISALAHEHGLPLLVDATFTTPWLLRPFDHGADLVYHSATKFLSGTAWSSAGCSSTAGRFDWDGGKFPTLTEPYAGFHDMRFAEESTTAAFLLRARREGLRDFGACMAPMTAWQILQGSRRFRCAWKARRERAAHRRVPARAADGRLDRLPRAARPSRPRARGEAPAARLRRRVPGRPQGHARAGPRFIESLRLFSHLANVGDAKSLVIHPASTTHFRMSADDLKRAGHRRGHHPAVDRASRIRTT